MIIGIDASRAKSKERTGTENYSLNLIVNLSKIDRKNQYILYLKDDYAKELNQLPKNFRLKVIKNKKYWTQIGLSREILHNRPDILFVPAHILPLFCPKASVLTVHDFTWKYFPEAYSKSDIFLQNLSLKRAIKKQSKIIVYSQSTKSDLLKFYPLDEKNINFVKMGFLSIKSEFASDDNRTPKKINSPYILSVGRLEKRKNISKLIEAYKLLRKERRIKHKLILVGKPGFGYNEIKNEIDSAGAIKEDIVETGYVSNDELGVLFENSSAFVYPSLYEGFGFPILESFAAGTPVVTSNRSSMPEVAGNGAILVNPEKPFEIAAALSQIINKKTLGEKLVANGRKQLLKYSWENCALETLKVIESAVKQKGGR